MRHRLFPLSALVIALVLPDREGEFFITHKTHGHNIVGKLIVQP